MVFEWLTSHKYPTLDGMRHGSWLEVGWVKGPWDMSITQHIYFIDLVMLAKWFSYDKYMQAAL